MGISDFTEPGTQESQEEKGNSLIEFNKILSGALNTDTLQYKSATEALNELLSSLEDPNNLVTLENRPKRKYEGGYYHEDIVPSREPAFVEKQTWMDGFPVEPVAYTESYKYRMAGEKEFHIYNKVFNSGYFPFNTLEAERIEKKKQIEVERTSEFKQQANYYSGFDSNIRNSAVREILALDYQGYIFTFMKIAHQGKMDSYSFKIEQFVSMNENNKQKKVLRDSRPLGNFGKEGFELLKKASLELAKNAVVEPRQF